VSDSKAVFHNTARTGDATMHAVVRWRDRLHNRYLLQ